MKHGFLCGQFLFTACLFFIACNTDNQTKIEPTHVETFAPNHVNEYVQKELTTNSSDISPCCCVSISESLFPNANRYQLDTPKIFFGVENSGFYINTEYFFSSNDSIVRAILYEWDWPKHRLTFSEKLSPERSTSNKLLAKYHMLVEGLKEGLGEPASHTIVEEDFYRESYRWNQDESPKAYIFILGDKQKNFYRLRLLTYE